MTKKQLKGYRDIKLERDDLARRIEELEAALYSARTQKLDGMPPGGGGADDRTDALLDKKRALLARYKLKARELADAQLEIETAINSLSPRARKVLRLYYIDGLTWEQVCERSYYSWGTVHKIHRTALNALGKQEEKPCN